MKAIPQIQTSSADLIASCVLALEMKQKQQFSSTGSRDVDACMDGGGANTAWRWVNRACWMGRQWIPAASSTQITQHQHHPHPYLGGGHHLCLASASSATTYCRISRMPTNRTSLSRTGTHGDSCCCARCCTYSPDVFGISVRI